MRALAFAASLIVSQGAALASDPMCRLFNDMPSISNSSDPAKSWVDAVPDFANTGPSWPTQEPDLLQQFPPEGKDWAGADGDPSDDPKIRTEALNVLKQKALQEVATNSETGGNATAARKVYCNFLKHATTRRLKVPAGQIESPPDNPDQ